MARDHEAEPMTEDQLDEAEAEIHELHEQVREDLAEDFGGNLKTDSERNDSGDL